MVREETRVTEGSHKKRKNKKEEATAKRPKERNQQNTEYPSITQDTEPKESSPLKTGDLVNGLVRCDCEW